jgi:broad specificity phosphatase PhoE
MKKTIIFVRHGQSEANKSDADDPSVLDAVLTDLGRLQAESWSKDNDLREKLRSVEICFCSPLRRAMETAALVFQNSPSVPIVANRYAREKWWNLWQCRGIPHNELVTYSQSLTREIFEVEKLKEVDKYWNPNIETSRILEGKRVSSKYSDECCVKLVKCLREHPANSIAVACHWGVINDLLDVVPTNCELITAQIDVETGTFDVVERRSVPTSLSSKGY